MKKNLIIIFLSLLFYVGCGEDGSICDCPNYEYTLKEYTWDRKVFREETTTEFSNCTEGYCYITRKDGSIYMTILPATLERKVIKKEAK